MNLIQKIKKYFKRKREEREYKKKIKELSKKDPFTYKNF